MADADEMEGPLDSGFPGRPVGGFGGVSKEEPFTPDVNGDKFVSVVRLYLPAVPVVNLAASLGHGMRIESHHRLTVAPFRPTMVLG